MSAANAVIVAIALIVATVEIVEIAAPAAALRATLLPQSKNNLF